MSARHEPTGRDQPAHRRFCARCRYDLSQHSDWDVCPECELSVRVTVDRLLKRRDVARHNRRLRHAFVAYVALFVALILISIGARSPLIWYAAHLPTQSLVATAWISLGVLWGRKARPALIAAYIVAMVVTTVGVHAGLRWIMSQVG